RCCQPAHDLLPLNLQRGLSKPAPLWRDRGFPHEIKIGEVARQVGIAFALDASLVGSAPLRGAFAVVGVQLVDHVHAGAHLPTRHKTHTVTEDALEYIE